MQVDQGVLNEQCITPVVYSVVPLCIIDREHVSIPQYHTSHAGIILCTLREGGLLRVHTGSPENSGRGLANQIFQCGEFILFR